MRILLMMQTFVELEVESSTEVIIHQLLAMQQVLINKSTWISRSNGDFIQRRFLSILVRLI